MLNEIKNPNFFLINTHPWNLSSQALTDQIFKLNLRLFYCWYNNITDVLHMLDCTLPKSSPLLHAILNPHVEENIKKSRLLTLATRKSGCFTTLDQQNNWFKSLTLTLLSKSTSWRPYCSLVIIPPCFFSGFRSSLFAL